MESVDIIKQSSRRIYFTITGGGTHALAKLLMSGGASNVFVGANIPYSELELDRILGVFNRKAVSVETAQNLALYSKWKSQDIGVGVTCKLMKNNEREGREHLVYMCISDKVRTVNYEFVPRGLCRYEQEVMVGNYILDTLAKFIGEKELVG